MLEKNVLGSNELVRIAEKNKHALENPREGELQDWLAGRTWQPSRSPTALLLVGTGRSTQLDPSIIPSCSASLFCSFCSAPVGWRSLGTGGVCPGARVCSYRSVDRKAAVGPGWEMALWTQLPVALAFLQPEDVSHLICRARANFRAKGKQLHGCWAEWPCLLLLLMRLWTCQKGRRNSHLVPVLILTLFSVFQVLLELLLTELCPELRAHLEQLNAT